MNRLYTVLKRIASKTMNQIIITLSFPVLILFVFALINNSFHLKNYESLIISNYTNELNSFLNDTEEKMTMVIHSANFISTNPDINYMLTATEKPTHAKAANSIKTLKQASGFVDIIDSVSIYNKNSNFVVSSNGLYHDASIYFNMIFPYENYSASYWSDYHSLTGDAKILAPTILTNDTSSQTRTIIPLVFTSLNNTVSGSLVIFNIDAAMLFEHFEIYRLTPNSNICMRDNNTGKIYTDSSFNNADVDNYTFVQALKSNAYSNTDIVSYENEKYLMIKSRDTSNSWGLTYLVTVPYSDIHDSRTNILLISITFVVILSICLMFFVFLGSKILYVPWKKLVSTTTSAQSSGEFSVDGNLADYVANAFLDISTANTSLRENLELTLPLSQEKYLIDILNNDQTPENSNSLLEPLSFKYDYFVALAISITINPTFLSTQEASGAEISKKLSKAIKSVFSSKFITYELPSANDLLYLLLNVENDLYTDSINQTIEIIKNMIEPDKDNLEILFGTGKIYKGFDGLKLTHREAIDNMIRMLNSGKIQLFSPNNTKYAFSANSENILKNYLTIGSIDRAKEFVDDIFDNILHESDSAKRQICSDVIICLRKTIRQKGVQSSNISADRMLEQLRNNSTVAYDDVKTQIFTLMDTISEHMQNNSRKIHIEEIIEYINEHYTENIFLEELAEMYNTTAKYLSKRIKQYLNVSFKDYIMELKINKAKELLENSNLTISELYLQVGFQDRNAFTRTFKAKTGITPSNYRLHYNEQKSLIIDE